MLNDKTVLLCPSCRFGVTKITEPVSFWSRMPDAFVYPFHGNGIWILASAALVLSLLGLVQLFFGLLGLLAGVAVAAGIGMLLINIIRTTAYDSEKPMEWPDISKSENMVETLVQLVGSFLLVFLPAIACSFLAHDSGWHWLGLGLWALGVVYYPMALPAVVIFDSVSAVNPLLVLPSIVRTFRQYLLVVGLLAVIWLLNAGVSALSKALPWGFKMVSRPVVEFYSLYSLAVSARLLGLLYQSNKNRLIWSE